VTWPHVHLYHQPSDTGMNTIYLFFKMDAVKF
jgi:hypothetical protein